MYNNQKKEGGQQTAEQVQQQCKCSHVNYYIYKPYGLFHNIIYFNINVETILIIYWHALSGWLINFSYMNLFRLFSNWRTKRLFNYFREKNENSG